MLGGGLKWKAGRLADLRGNKNNNLLSITCTSLPSITCTSLPSILTRHVWHSYTPCMAFLHGMYGMYGILTRHVYFQIVKVYAKDIYNVFDT